MDNITYAKNELLKEYSIYKAPSNNSLSADEWLKQIPTNTSPILKDSNLLQTLLTFKVIQKINYEDEKVIKGGYVPYNKYIENGLMEVKESMTLSNNNKISIYYSVKFTKKGRDVFEPLVFKLIEFKQILTTIQRKKKF